MCMQLHFPTLVETNKRQLKGFMIFLVRSTSTNAKFCSFTLDNIYQETYPIHKTCGYQHFCDNAFLIALQIIGFM